MDAAAIVVNATMLVINMFLLLAALNKYTRAQRTLDDVKKLATRAILLRGGRRG